MQSRINDFLLILLGAGIPVAVWVLSVPFGQPGPLYFIIIAPVYIFYCLGRDKGARKVVAVFCMIGMIIPLVEWGAARLLPGAAAEHIKTALLALFPSSLMATALDTSPPPSLGYAALACFAAVAFNAVLYSLYGCVLYYISKLFGTHKTISANTADDR